MTTGEPNLGTGWLPGLAGLRVSAPLFAITLVLSALLLFSVQPMFTRMVLPLLGGSPAVWNTAVVFFQAMLLGGYLYAHLLTRLPSVAAQAALHVGLLTLAFFLLPIAVPADWAAPTSGSPVPWLLTVLAVALGIPFLAVSASAPLLQKWFARTGHKHAGDPYFLYGASNLGSLTALLGYPVVIEPLLGLGEQSGIWMWGYLGLIGLIALSAFSAWQSRGATKAPSAAHLLSHVDWRRRARWVVLSFVPSSLLLGLTLHISTDIASAPFLWVIPLAIYLLTFVIVFARRWAGGPDGLLDIQVAVLIPLAIYFWTGILWLNLTVHLIGFFVVALVCHNELAKRRPSPEHLTEFYLWMSVGGLLGGAVTVLAAPAVFDSVLEYPLALGLACLLRPGSFGGARKDRLLDFVWPTALVGLFLIPGIVLELTGHVMGLLESLVVLLSAAAVLYTFRNRPLRLALGLMTIIFLPQILGDPSLHLARERSFFGVYRVESTRDSRVHVFRHGTTIHGIEFVEPLARAEPLSYYSREGPLGQVLGAINRMGRVKSIGVVGLGVGAIACYRGPRQTMTYYEIDPVVEDIARDTRYFHFLEVCGESVEVIIGDARLSLARDPSRTYDLMILDAFSSDAIPLHLVTREAMALYLARINDGGYLIFHISNKFLDLEPVLAALIDDAGLAARIQEHSPVETEWQKPNYEIDIILGSKWVVIARTEQDLAILSENEAWRVLRRDPGQEPWTDDFTDVFSAIMWR